MADSSAGQEVQKNIQKETEHYTFVAVPDTVASNVLRVGSTLLIQEGFPISEKILGDLCEQKQIALIKINMSELIKADGALTCGSLLFGNQY